jgi:hypothetical protein
MELDWVANYARNEFKEAVQGKNILSLMMTTRNSLIRRTGIKTIAYECGILDDDAPTEAAAVSEDRLGRKQTFLLSICSNESRQWRRRPSQEQLDKIISIVGREPRWWVDWDCPDSCCYY